MLGYGNIRIVTASGEAGVDNLTSIRQVDASSGRSSSRKRLALQVPTACSGTEWPPRRRPVHRSRRPSADVTARSASSPSSATPGPSRSRSSRRRRRSCSPASDGEVVARPTGFDLRLRLRRPTLYPLSYRRVRRTDDRRSPRRRGAFIAAGSLIARASSRTVPVLPTLTYPWPCDQ